jgi:cellulose synthase/poly-beta-1,6-N-acetylglucosamine synthase-like glycosyltransferase
MADLISYLSLSAAILVSIPTAVIFLEIVAAAVLPARERLERSSRRPRIAALVPAHNEGRSLLPTLTDIKADLIAGDRLLVVADNCTDDTADVAFAAGAEVSIRNDPQKIGKGYALDWGVRHLCVDPPEVLIVVDADCRISRDTVNFLAMTCHATGRPVQALYLITSPAGTTIDYRVAEFALRVKNWIRPLGLNALNLPCQLMGTGMAFPFDVIRRSELATGQIVEDLKLGLDLAQLGKSAEFCPGAVVISQFPTSLSAARSQRDRWEHGHIGIILRMVPRLLCKAIVDRNWPLLALTIDAAVPPLTLLVLMVFTTSTISLLCILRGYSAVAFIVSSSSFAAFVGAMATAWWKHGYDLLPPREMLSVAHYVIAKFQLYCRFLTQGSDAKWIRTDRDKSNTQKP